MRYSFNLRNGIWWGLISIVLFLILHGMPALSELLYGRIFYPSYQFLRSLLSFLIPFPLIYLFVGLLILYLGRKVYKFIAGDYTILDLLHKILSIIGYSVFLFYLLWGYNYTRPNLKSKLDLQVENPPDSAYVMNEYKKAIAQVNETRMELGTDSLLWYGLDRRKLFESIEPDLKYFLRKADFPTAYATTVSSLQPKGIALRFKTSGFFFPYTGEAYVDAGVPDISAAHTFAHELSHVYGVTNEGEANFVAMKTCMSNGDPLVNYAGYLHYLAYASAAARQVDTTEHRRLHNTLDSAVLADISSRRKCYEQYPDIFPVLRDGLYNFYLKSNGVEGGIKSYAGVYLLEYAWREKYAE